MLNTCALACVLSAIAAQGADAETTLPALKFEDKTSANMPITFTVQKTKWRNEKIQIWGQFTNNGHIEFKSVSVSLTALDKDRKFLGRQKHYSDPMDLEPGEEGTINAGWIDTEKKVPKYIQFKVQAKQY